METVVRILGYSFDQPAQAHEAREVLMERYGMRPGDAQVADLADDGFVLGIRAREENIPDLARSLRDLGGDPLVDVDEKLTGLQPRS